MKNASNRSRTIAMAAAALLCVMPASERCAAVPGDVDQAPPVSVQVDLSGSVAALGRRADENLLARPIPVRILERRLADRRAPGPAASENETTIGVANQHTALDDLTRHAVKRELRLTIEDCGVEPTRLETAGRVTTVVKSDAGAELQWTTTVASQPRGAIISIALENRADRLRSFDVEIPIALAGGDYAAFFPGQNDFPEWPDDCTLAYALRAYDSGFNFLSQPAGTFFSRPRHVGLTVAADYARPILPFTLHARKSGGDTVVLATFVRVRLDPHGGRTIRLHLAPHAGDWRGGLSYARDTWPAMFRVSPETSRFFAATFGGSGALGTYYPNCFTEPAFWRNYMLRDNPWRSWVLEMMGLERWFGVFVSDVDAWTPAVAEKWGFVSAHPEWFPKAFLEGKPPEDASCAQIVEWIESRPPSLFRQIRVKGRSENKPIRTYVWDKVTHDGVRKFIRTAHDHGASMFLYWNPRDVWYPYARDHYSDLIVYRAKDYFGFDCAYVSAPKGSAFYNALVGQVERMFEVYPDLDGFFIDQCYGAAGWPAGYDDGWSVSDDGRAGSDFNANFAEVTAAAARVAHDNGKFVWTNHCHEPIDIIANSDLGCSEDRQSPGMGQEVGRYALIGNRPGVNLQVGEDINMVSLRDGVHPGLTPVRSCDDYETRSTADAHWRNRLYAPMFDLFRRRSWCLEPDCLTLPEGFEGNLFRVDEEENLLATVVAFGESFVSPWTRLNVPVTVRVHDVDEWKAAYVIGAAQLGAFKVPFQRTGDELTVRIPRFKGAAAVLLVKRGRFVSIEAAAPIATVGGTWAYSLAADNFTDEPWNWKGTLWIGPSRDWYWEEIPAGAGVGKPFAVTLPVGYAKSHAQVRFAKEVPSRLPVADGALNDVATFEFVVESPIAATLAPSRAMVARTMSNSNQGGYVPFHEVVPLHVCEKETVEIELGVVNHGSSSAELGIGISADRVAVVDQPGQVVLPAKSQTVQSVRIRGLDRGPALVNVAVSHDGKVVAAAALNLTVIGTRLAEPDVANVRAASLLYDIWGSSRTNGADAKAITLNGVAAGDMQGSGGYPVWIQRVRTPLSEPAREALRPANRIVIGNPGGAFWKVRNFVLELTLTDGSLIHLRAGPRTWSSPADWPWSEGTRVEPGTNIAFACGGPASR